MNLLRRTAALFGLTLALLPWSHAALAADRTAELAALHAADDAWVAAYNAGRVEPIVRLYDRHAVVFAPGLRPLRGRSAIRAYLTKDDAEFVRGGLIYLLVGPRDGEISGRLGWVSGNYLVKDRTGRIVDRGWYFSVSRLEHGHWLYVRDTWNSDPSGAAH